MQMNQIVPNFVPEDLFTKDSKDLDSRQGSGIGCSVGVQSSELQDVESKKKAHMMQAPQVLERGVPATPLVIEPEDDTLVRSHLVKVAVSENVPNAMFAIDLGHLQRQAKIWKKTFPRVQPFYALKSCPDEKVVKELAGSNVNFDCASWFEIQMALAAGATPERIIYANPIKFPADIAHAKEVGVSKITFDNGEELEKIAAIYPEAECVLRIVTDDSAAVCQFSAKFGAFIDDCPFLLEKAKSLGLNVVGVSFHVGSGTTGADSYLHALTNARKVFDMAVEAGFPPLQLLDIGGGMPGDDSGTITIEDIGEVVNMCLASMFPDENIKVIAEPGRFFCHGVGTLAARVIGKRPVRQPGQGDPEVLYYIADGVYGSFNCMFYDHYTPAVPIAVSDNGQDITADAALSRMFGPTCDGLDMLYSNEKLPDVNIGDWFVFKNMGAYTFAAASRFNGVEKPRVTYIRTEVKP